MCCDIGDMSCRPNAMSDGASPGGQVLLDDLRTRRVTHLSGAAAGGVLSALGVTGPAERSGERMACSHHSVVSSYSRSGTCHVMQSVGNMSPDHVRSQAHICCGHHLHYHPLTMFHVLRVEVLESPTPEYTSSSSSAHLERSQAGTSSARLHELDNPTAPLGVPTEEPSATAAAAGGGGSAASAEASPRPLTPERLPEGGADAKARRAVQSYPISGLASEHEGNEAARQVPSTLSRGSSSATGLRTLSQTSQEWLRSLSQPNVYQVRRPKREHAMSGPNLKQYNLLGMGNSRVACNRSTHSAM